MVEHGNQCYDFSIDPNVNNVPWSIARDACQNSGLNMITEGSHGLDNWITDHLYNTGIFSYGYTVNGMWIGYYGKSILVCICSEAKSIRTSASLCNKMTLFQESLIHG